jgi:hypothetical protein
MRNDELFFEAIKQATAHLDDSEKIEFYEELLETGSASVVSKDNIEFDFNIENRQYEIGCIGNPNEKQDAVETQELFDDIDYIITNDEEEFINNLDEERSEGE